MLRIIFFGLIATFVGAVILTGGFIDAVFVFLCPFTAVVWIPTVFISGAIIVSLIDGPTGRAGKGNAGTDVPATINLVAQLASAATMASQEAALKTYLDQAKAKGIERDQVISMLVRNGWSESAFRDALDERYTA